MDNYARYSDKEGVKTFDQNGFTYIDQGYCLGQKVRVKRGNEIVTGIVVSLTPDIIYRKSYVENHPPTITVKAIWNDGKITEVDFDPKTNFPPDFAGQQFHFQKLLS